VYWLLSVLVKYTVTVLSLDTALS